MAERRLIHEIVEAVVPDLVEDAVVPRGVEWGDCLREDVELDPILELGDERLAVIGDAAARGWKRGEQRDPHRQRTNSTESVPSDTGTLIRSGVRAGSRAKKTSALTSDRAPFTETTT